MTDNTQPEATAFCWATELAMTQQPVTLSVTEAREVSAKMQRLHAENTTLQAGYAAARLEIESLQARIKTMAEEHADELTVAHMDGITRAAQPAGAQQPAKAESLRQILTDPENQPNQYGVQFLMHGAKMAFMIGNRQFCLDYEPDEPGEFEFMRDALISAFSIFTPDVKMAQQPSPTPQADSQPAHQQEARPVTPYTCPKCHALWLHWPAEQSGFGVDTLNCRSATHCDYCEKGGVEQLERLERVPAALKAPQQEAQEPVGYTHASWIAEAKRGGGGSFVGRKNAAFDVPIYTAPQPSPTPQADSQPAHQQEAQEGKSHGN